MARKVRLVEIRVSLIAIKV
uniref:Uncharacterized protein n=1 Tax=Vitis vinifera TaxID=29760 RepID=F6H1F1_VITVI